MPLLEFSCVGLPRQIGFDHGSQAAHLVKASLDFYQDYFKRRSKMDWTTAQTAASKYLPLLEQHVPHLVEEMRGLAEGANVEFLSIVAINARSEISMGMMNDGCTTIGWKTKNFSLAGQNWDWETGQKDNLVLAHIIPAQVDGIQRPKISMVTEAGIIGKTGINSYGVAAFINAVRTKGFSDQRLPVHIALRVILDSASRAEAVAKLSAVGVGTSAHEMVADSTGCTSLEFTHQDTVRIEMVKGQIAHSNHFLAAHGDLKETILRPDSLDRVKRATLLLKQKAQSPAATASVGAAFAAMESILEDEEGYPTSINRKCRPTPDGKVSATLFSIMTDLQAVTARVRLGRPTEPEGEWILRPALL